MKRILLPISILISAGALLTACEPASSSGSSVSQPSGSNPAGQPGGTTSGAGASPSPLSGATPPAPGPVPSQYQSTYDTLASQVQAFTAVAGSSPPRSDTVLSSSLTPADGNAMSPNVLQGGALARSTQMVGLMKALGETGVTIQVGFPLLVNSFPDSSTYTTFYQQVAQVVHEQGLVLTVELNPLFPAFSALPVKDFYQGLTLQSYISDTAQEAQTIIDVMAPKYLSFLNEPDTYTGNIHNPAIDLKNPAVGVQFVSGVLAGLERHGTLLGAGTGTWTDPSYDAALLAQTSIDFLDLHMYPVAADDVANMQAQTQDADEAHKGIVMTECWLYKESTNGQPIESSAQGSIDEQKDGTFSFWEPLDEQFLRAMIDYARNNGFEVVSPFSTLDYFSYLNWTPQLGAESNQQVRSAFDQQVTQAMSAGDLSGAGETVKSLAAS
jgi:hypothetical protein